MLTSPNFTSVPEVTNPYTPFYQFQYFDEDGDNVTYSLISTGGAL